MSDSASSLPLSRLRVLAVEQYGAGPFGTSYLADLGAEVVKIENHRDGGDVGRHVGPHFFGADDSHFFQTFNRNKKSSRPICITRLFLNPMLTGIEGKLRERKTAVYALIEREYKVSIQRVEQELQGVLLGADDAANLESEPGAPALRILRRYYSDQGTLLEVADNIHPSDRFTYRMELRR